MHDYRIAIAILIGAGRPIADMESEVTKLSLLTTPGDTFGPAPGPMSCITPI